MADIGIKKNEVGKKGKKSSVLPRIIAKDAHVTIDREDCRYEIGKKKKKQSKIERGFLENEPLTCEHFKKPERKNCNCEYIDADHLVEFKEFVIEREDNR